MSEIKTGGPAFPWCGDLNETPYINLGLTIRDYFAAHCPIEEVTRRMPSTVGEIADRCVELGWVSTDARKSNVLTCYRPEHVHSLRAMARYDYADAMIRARGE
jgi:hypothetical protein